MVHYAKTAAAWYLVAGMPLPIWVSLALQRSKYGSLSRKSGNTWYSTRVPGINRRYSLDYIVDRMLPSPSICCSTNDSSISSAVPRACHLVYTSTFQANFRAIPQPSTDRPLTCGWRSCVTRAGQASVDDAPALQDVEVETTLALGKVDDATKTHAGVLLPRNPLLDPASNAADKADRTSMATRD